MRQSNFLRNIWLGVENLLLHKLRSFLTMLGVVFGVGSVVAMLVRRRGGQQGGPRADPKARQQQHHHHVHEVGGGGAGAARSPSHMSVYGLTYEDHRRHDRTFARSSRSRSRLVRGGDPGQRTMELRVMGTSADWFDLVPREVDCRADHRQSDGRACSGRRAHRVWDPQVARDRRGHRPEPADRRADYEVVGIVKSESG